MARRCLPLGLPSAASGTRTVVQISPPKRQWGECQASLKAASIEYLTDDFGLMFLLSSLLMTFQSHPQHLINDPHVYSMDDILQVRTGELEIILAQLVEDAVAHITQCQVGLID